MSADNSVVVIKQLTKRYGTFTALEDLSLTIQAGQILGMIGPNGAGKTTCIKILVGLARPSSGTASIGGADCVRDARRIKHLVGYMPDKFGSYDNMRVHEYLDFFGATFGLSRPVRKQRPTGRGRPVRAPNVPDRSRPLLVHTTVGAPTEQLKPVVVDPVARPVLDVTNHGPPTGVVDIGAGAAVRADHVMVVDRLADHVGVFPVRQVEPFDRLQVPPREDPQS